MTAVKNKKISVLIFPVIALILEILPCGVTMRFASPPGEEPFIENTSYFDLLPLGYGNFAPLITAVLTAVLLVVLLFYIIKGGPALWKTGKNISLAAAVVSVCPVLFASYTVIGGFISASLSAEFLYLTFKKPTGRKSEKPACP